MQQLFKMIIHVIRVQLSVFHLTIISCWWEEIEDRREDGSKQGGAGWTAHNILSVLQLTVRLTRVMVCGFYRTKYEKKNNHQIINVEETI